MYNSSMNNTDKNTSNLIPFTGADDPRRQNGRTKGSRNIATIVRDLLSEDMDLELIDDISLKQSIVNRNSPTTYAEALSESMVVRALNGNVRAAEWIAKQSDKAPDLNSFFNQPVVIFKDVEPNHPQKYRDEVEGGCLSDNNGNGDSDSNETVIAQTDEQPDHQSTIHFST